MGNQRINLKNASQVLSLCLSSFCFPEEKRAVKAQPLLKIYLLLDKYFILIAVLALQ